MTYRTYQYRCMIKKLFKNLRKSFLLGFLWILFVYFNHFLSHNGTPLLLSEIIKIS